VITPDNLICTSVDDCAASLKCRVDSDPAEALSLISQALQHMNRQRIEHKSRRAVMVREAKRAITTLGNGYEKQTF
jgi:hypothetical protein